MNVLTTCKTQGIYSITGRYTVTGRYYFEAIQIISQHFEAVNQKDGELLMIDQNKRDFCFNAAKLQRQVTVEHTVIE